MPIYAYKCSACGHAKDVLQKISDAPLSVCPECGQSTFSKQVTAAGFQLKGSGWYVTDFRNKGGSAPAKSGESTPSATGNSGASTPAPAATESSGTTTAATTPAPAASPTTAA